MNTVMRLVTLGLCLILGSVVMSIPDFEVLIEGVIGLFYSFVIVTIAYQIGKHEATDLDITLIEEAIATLKSYGAHVSLVADLAKMISHGPTD